MSTTPFDDIYVNTTFLSRAMPHHLGNVVCATDFLSAIHSATGIDLLALYSQHVTEQQAEAQVEEMKESKDVFSGSVQVEDGSLFGRRMALEELYQMFVGRMREEDGVKGLGQVSIDIMGVGGVKRP